MTEQDLLTRLRLPQFSTYPAHGTGMVSLVTAQNVADMKEAAAEIERLRAALETVAAGGPPAHPVTYPTPLACAAATVENFMEVARKAIDRRER